ncbi:MAG: hypothetical protein Q7N50_12800 [Armatimonadota bacterium]|nr:hypothetical protein [Armatimonadota bacterium]
MLKTDALFGSRDRKEGTSKPLELRSTSSNIVIVAQNFNPSIPTKDWLQHNITGERPNNFVNTPLVSVFETDRFTLTVDQNRFQITMATPMVHEEAVRVAVAYVKKLPETRYTALGFNYHWEADYTSELERLNDLKAKWAQIVQATAYFFDKAGPTVGTVTTGMVKGAKVRIVAEPRNDAALVVFGINFHFDLPDQQGQEHVEHLVKLVGQFTDRFAQAKEMALILLEEEVSVSATTSG